MHPSYHLRCLCLMLGGNKFGFYFNDRRDRGGRPVIGIDSGSVVLRHSATALVIKTNMKLLEMNSHSVPLISDDKEEYLRQSLKNSPVAVVEKAVSRSASNNGKVVEIMTETEKIMQRKSNNDSSSLSFVSQSLNSSSGKLESGKISASIRKAELRGATVAPSGFWRKRAWAVSRTVQIWVFLVSVVIRLLRLMGLKMMLNRREAKKKSLISSESPVEARHCTVSHLSFKYSEYLLPICIAELIITCMHLQYAGA